MTTGTGCAEPRIREDFPFGVLNVELEQIHAAEEREYVDTGDLRRSGLSATDDVAVGPRTDGELHRPVGHGCSVPYDLPLLAKVVHVDLPSMAGDVLAVRFEARDVLDLEATGSHRPEIPTFAPTRRARAGCPRRVSAPKPVAAVRRACA
jgi:hypothetical protein